DYIDITFDGRFCKCPFSNNRREIGEQEIGTLFDHKFEVDCIYNDIFNGGSVW
ncbi:MAG: hypothetical protein GY861_15055, partial [bacterium]|nr:hypothetical protein [bacterium]